jgi:hypothetical protein
MRKLDWAKRSEYVYMSHPVTFRDAGEARAQKTQEELRVTKGFQLNLVNANAAIDNDFFLASSCGSCET